MAFGLSFSGSFFKQEGDDDLTPDNAESEIGNPTSVWQALMLKTEKEWDEIAKEVFDLENGDQLDCDMVIDKIRETDTCTDLSSPVHVYIDEEGYYTVDIYDESATKQPR